MLHCTLAAMMAHSFVWLSMLTHWWSMPVFRELSPSGIVPSFHDWSSYWRRGRTLTPSWESWSTRENRWPLKAGTGMDCQGYVSPFLRCGVPSQRGSSWHPPQSWRKGPFPRHHFLRKNKAMPWFEDIDCPARYPALSHGIGHSKCNA